MKFVSRGLLMSALLFTACMYGDDASTTTTTRIDDSTLWDVAIHNLYFADSADTNKKEGLAFVLLMLEHEKDTAPVDFKALTNTFTSKYGIAYDKVRLGLPRLDVCEAAFKNVADEAQFAGLEDAGLETEKTTAESYYGPAKNHVIEKLRHMKTVITGNTDLLQNYNRFYLSYLTLFNEAKRLSSQFYVTYKDTLKTALNDRVQKLQAALSTYRQNVDELNIKLAASTEQDQLFNDVRVALSSKERAYKHLENEAESLIAHWQQQAETSN